MVEKSTVGNRLLAHFHSRRFGYGDSYYRQLKFIKSTTGVDCAASTVDGWEDITYKKLQRLLRCLRKVIMQSTYIKADETKLKYLSDVGKGEPSMAGYRCSSPQSTSWYCLNLTHPETNIYLERC
ncbi:transposase [Chitinophaga sp. S165]|uniref:IS66 family transposase n=1 Tax=Chitinophaga sp. S165 TaxID=2135462 RepID=UPI000D93980F|nr:transposase IS66 family protein [Chitinophaga sp. S165]